MLPSTATSNSNQSSRTTDVPASYRYRAGPNNASEGVRSVTPYITPILPPHPRVHGSQRNSPVQGKNLFQRVLVQITDWVKTRIAEARICSALAPFIKAACRKSELASATHRYEALIRAVETAFSIQHDAEGMISKTVQGAMHGMVLEDKVNLKNLLELDQASSDRARNELALAVNASVAQSRMKDAGYFVLQAMDNIAEAANPATATNLAVATRWVCLWLEGHLRLITPSNNAQSGESSATPCRVTRAAQLEHISCVSGLQIRDWFNGKSLTDQRNIRNKLTRIANDSSFKRAEKGSNERVFQDFTLCVRSLLPQS